jgi:cell division septal protein FtsQ
VKPGWKILGGAAAGLVIWFGGPALLRRLDFFRVRRVEVVGIRYQNPKAVVAALQLPLRASVFDNLSGMEKRVAAVPGIDRASVGRRLPGTLTVELEETEPVALAPKRGGGLAFVDQRGKLLPFDPTAAAPDLPVANAADSALAHVLAVVRDHDPTLFARLSAASRVRDDVILEVQGRRVWLSANATPEDIRAVMAVAQDLVRQNRSYQELDGRFAGQVIVRGAGA